MIKRVVLAKWVTTDKVHLSVDSTEKKTQTQALLLASFVNTVGAAKDQTFFPIAAILAGNSKVITGVPIT